MAEQQSLKEVGKESACSMAAVRVVIVVCVGHAMTVMNFEWVVGGRTVIATLIRRHGHVYRCLRAALDRLRIQACDSRDGREEGQETRDWQRG